VHQFGQASFGILAAAGQYGSLFHENRRKWEAKWSCQWRPYERRRSEEYAESVRAIRSAVQQVVPKGSTIVVVSRGDDELLELPGCTAWHFPRAPDGEYAGFYPVSGGQAVALLQDLQRCGAGYLVLPETSAWWLDRYEEFGQYLGQRPAEQLHVSDHAAIYRLPVL
jgi:hypothetical protein